MLSGHHLAGVANHIIEQLIFAVRQIERFAFLVNHIHIGIHKKAEMVYPLLAFQRFTESL
ncbi:hypothetical protein D3C74_465000 [compost metagenome]